MNNIETPLPTVESPERNFDLSGIGRAWEKGSSPEGRALLAESIREDISKLHEGVENNPEILQVREQLNAMEETQFRNYLEKANQTARNFGRQVLRESRDKGTITAGQAESDAAHYDEVTELAMSWAEDLELDREQLARVLLGARLHDVAKLADRPDFAIFGSLIHHELISAVAIRESLGDLFPEFPGGYANTVAATAAGHGRGEFPQFTAGSLGIEYHTLPLASRDLPSNIIHLADVIQGVFGKSGRPGQEIIGESWLKYMNAHLKMIPELSIRASLTSSMQSAMTNIVEVSKSVADFPDKTVAKYILDELKQQAGLAQAFYTYAEEQLGDEIDHIETGENRVKVLAVFQELLTSFRIMPSEERAQRTRIGSNQFQMETFPSELAQWKTKLGLQLQKYGDSSNEFELQGAALAATTLREIDRLTPQPTSEIM
jgi:HD superfamily phosphohydrolase YqeK